MLAVPWRGHQDRLQQEEQQGRPRLGGGEVFRWPAHRADRARRRVARQRQDVRAAQVPGLAGVVNGNPLPYRPPLPPSITLMIALLT